MGSRVTITGDSPKQCQSLNDCFLNPRNDTYNHPSSSETGSPTVCSICLGHFCVTWIVRQIVSWALAALVHIEFPGGLMDQSPRFQITQYRAGPGISISTVLHSSRGHTVSRRLVVSKPSLTSAARACLEGLLQGRENTSGSMSVT